MKKYTFLLLTFWFGSAAADEWKQLSGYSLYDLYMHGGNFTKEEQKKLGVTLQTKMISSHGLSLPDGRQASVIYVEVTQEKEKTKTSNLYKCIEYYSRDMSQTSQVCYELRK